MARKAASETVGIVEPGAAPVTIDMVITELRLLSTSDRLLGLYELGIDACTNRTTEHVTAILEELISTLDFQYADIAQGFHRLYMYCLERAREGSFDQVGFIFQDLRDTLTKAVNEGPAAQVTPLSRAAGA